MTKHLIAIAATDAIKIAVESGRLFRKSVPILIVVLLMAACSRGSGRNIAQTMVTIPPANRPSPIPTSVPAATGAIAIPVAWREWVASPEKPESHFGFSVGTAGDVNGDGYADVVIGADRYVGWTGRAYVYTGSTSVTVVQSEPTWSCLAENSNFDKCIH